jgi:enoyl-CoA hydratase
MTYENLTTSKENGLGWIVINRPDKLNALNIKTVEEMQGAFLAFKEDMEVKAVILTGSGEKAFIAGADISELAKLDHDAGRQYVLKGQELTKLMENYPKPVIAAVNGYALGGGTEMALRLYK